ncbi:DUF3408 domain-containing protein [Bacteroides uniformis]|uniref:DUF3408 domain-containing protein n=1 Tax=Bacteroides uniformis TaxID=820 RepID=A0A6I0LSJ3_BACUN|nr:DUF3408 domain-containing protein [Bacteroides uniformis]KAB4253872.1 DUF3408 domain-containing protein [Bacteroides uniformis]KAB4254051.1 DUF3408 domain-containing protein [Bacteroides uniformis]KAB4257619.1 DUF3408 domain-containing protein [Bacteroides uniformis]KAB4260436.1 DUF3408 domain-containing protein [Bacteroides uniformis]
MAKKIVNVDEDLLRDYMSGNVTDPPGNDEGGQAEKPAEETGGFVPEKGRTRSKREEKSDYREKYLVNHPLPGRIQVYVNRRLYEHIKHFLPVIAPDVSISSYISNIVAEHIELYLEEINKMYKDRFSPLNKYDKYGN